VLNGDDDAVRAMATRTAARIVLVGQSPDCDVRARDIALDDLGRPAFELVTDAGSARVELRLTG